MITIHRTSSCLCGTRTPVERTPSINWLAPNTSIKQQHYHLYKLQNKHHSIHTKKNLHTINNNPHLIISPLFFTGVPLLNPTVFYWRETLVASPFLSISPGIPKLSHLLDGARFRSVHLTQKPVVEPRYGLVRRKIHGSWGYG